MSEDDAPADEDDEGSDRRPTDADGDASDSHSGDDYRGADEQEDGTVDPGASDGAPLSDLRNRVAERRGNASERAGDAEPTAPAEDAPLSNLASDVRSRSETDLDDDSPFEAVDVETVDGEALWDTITEEGEEPPEPTPDTAVVDADDTGDPDEHVVDKRELCQRCEYFSEPPEVACSHDGTDIVELVDSDRFRVRNCPKVVDADEGWRSKLDEE